MRFVYLAMYIYIYIYILEVQDMRGIAGEVRVNSSTTFSYGLLQIKTAVLVHRQKLIYISSMRTLDAFKTN